MDRLTPAEDLSDRLQAWARDHGMTDTEKLDAFTDATVPAIMSAFEGLPAGWRKCPLCEKRLRDDTAAVNDHYDTDHNDDQAEPYASDKPVEGGYR